MTPDEIIAELNASNLRGRGGAFFPTGRKWSFVPKPDQNPRPHYLVVNADESEPGTFKDREIMLRVPFRFLEGCLIAARAIESTHVFVYIRGEYEREYEVLVHALGQLPQGQAPRRRHDRRPPRGRRVHLRRGDRAARVARGRARPAADEAAVPRDRRPLRVADGGQQRRVDRDRRRRSSRWAAPSTRSSASRARRARASSRSRATSSNPGNYELPHGFPLKDLIHDVGGGIPDGRTLKAVIPGGSSTPILTAAEAERVTLDFDSLSQAGTMIGSAAVIVIDDRACMVQLGIRVSQFYEHESCGKCTPCRVGTRWLTQILKKIEAGSGTHADLDLLLDVGERINGTCLCPLGDSDAIAVASYVAKFREEFLAHVEEGGCPFHGTSSLDAIVAPTDVHAAHVGPAEIPRPLEVVGMSELITVTIDDREVEVEKGTGLVETAAAAGIEIPVFCYEPRLGPPVGACRMCLVEIEGLPKLQAGCTLTAQEGMVVRTAATSQRAADGQQGTLEFILVNHPLDCPVCDKGGECPLQDLTFRYGPGLDADDASRR